MEEIHILYLGRESLLRVLNHWTRNDTEPYARYMSVYRILRPLEPISLSGSPLVWARYLSEVLDFPGTAFSGKEIQSSSDRVLASHFPSSVISVTFLSSQNSYQLLHLWVQDLRKKICDSHRISWSIISHFEFQSDIDVNLFQMKTYLQLLWYRLVIVPLGFLVVFVSYLERS